MADDKDNVGGADRKRINPEEDYEVKYWSEKFGVAPEVSKTTVKTVGPMADDVAKALGK